MPEGSANWNFEGSVVLITNTSDPRARAQASAFSQAGATAVLCDRDVDQLDVSELTAGPGRSVETMAVDFADENSASQLADRVSEHYGKLDVLVFNDTSVPNSSLLDVSTELWGDLVQNHLDAGFLCFKHLVPMMISAKSGKIVLTVGPEASFSMAGRTAAGVMQYSLYGLSKDLALEVGKDQINVNVAAADIPLDELNHDDRSLAALTHSVCWLASDAARFVTGTLFRGGREPAVRQLDFQIDVESDYAA